MRIAVACLALLFPVWVFAAPTQLKDKYLNCNCQITPGIPWKTKPAQKAAVHHVASHKAKTANKPATPPVTAATPAKHVRKHVAAKKPAQGDTTYPGREEIISSNKLVLPAGKSVYAPGELVYISGRVLDMKCVPVSDAIVDIWQADPEGKYVSTTLGERLSPAPTFTGTGRATTDNLGRFNFVTIFPGTVNGRAPFIHVRVIHKDFPTLDTEMFFGQDRRNEADPVYSSLTSLEQQKLTAKVWERDVNDPEKGLGASWDISLNGKNPWRHF
jgi:protocatechuate 3,4-dioxygenase beta subunit